MSTNHYIVAHLDHSWQFSVKGNVTGPFGTREEAVAAAIEDAAESGAPDAEVIVRDADLKTETVWRPGQPAA